MGWIWGLIHPLVLLVTWWFVFGVCLRVPRPEGYSSYPLFIFAGMLPWLLFSETVQRSASSLLDQANLITKTVFPAEIVPVSVFLSTLVSHTLALTLLVMVEGAKDHRASPFLVALPLYTFLIGLLAVGLGWVVASLHVFLRDTAQGLSVVLTFWFWATPIMFTDKQFPDWGQRLLPLNPMFYAVHGYREMLLTTNPPRLQDFAILGAWALAIFVLGGLFFRYMKRGFADVL
jgi:ABC-type polysaccharide/polyol phosphate export permease